MVYCLRSRWYFTDIATQIDFMLYFVEPSGKIIFDFMNKYSEYIKVMLAKKNRTFILTIVKNVIKTSINVFRLGRYKIDTLFGFRMIIYSRDEIETNLQKRRQTFKCIPYGDIEAHGGYSVDNSLSNDQKVVYVVHKP